MVARVERSGAFFGELPNETYDEATAVVPGVADAIAVPLEDGRISSSLLLPVEIDDSVELVAKDDCGCGDGSAPRLATHDDLALSPETFTVDLGTCGCIEFNKPNRAIEEFDFFTVVRTTEPQVRRITLEEADRTLSTSNGSSPNGTSPDGRPTVTPVVALAYDVRLEARALSDAAAFQVSLVSADETRHVVLQHTPTAGSRAMLLNGAEDETHGLFSAFTLDMQKVFLGTMSPTVRSWTVTENTDGANAIGLDLSSIRRVEVLGGKPNSPWALAGLGISVVTDTGDRIALRIEGDEFHEASPWLELFSSKQNPARPAWSASAGAAVAVAYAINAAGSSTGGAEVPEHVNVRALIEARESMMLPATGRSVLDKDVIVDWDETPTLHEAATVAHGHLLHFKQQWLSDGYSLGDLLYSLPLAPGQKKLISVVDWDRRERTERVETTTSREGLDAVLARDRDLGEVVTGALTESMRGGSRNTTSGIGVGTGGAGNGSYEGMNFGALMGVSGGYGESNSSAWQTSGKTIAASSLQTLRDKTLQSAAAVRSLRTSVVQTVSQGESTRVTTEVVANHNHCHALTIQYFEVLRHLKVVHRLADVRECLFVPLPVKAFDGSKTLRWRQSLASYLRRPELANGFDATRRVETRWSEVDYPLGRYADEQVASVSGELELTILIPLPPLPPRPLPRPEQTAEQISKSLREATNPTSGFLGVLTAIATGGASLIADQAIGAAEQATKAAVEGSRALADELLAQTSPQAQYEKFQHEVMPGVAAGFVDQLELWALVRGKEMQIGSADFTLVSDYRPAVPLLASVRANFPPGVRRGEIQQIRVKSKNGLPNGCRVIVNSATFRYRTRLFEHPLVDDRRANDDIDLPVVSVSFGDPLGLPKVTQVAVGRGAALSTPLDAWEQRNPRTEDRFLSAALIEHLNEHLEYYHHAIWWTMDPNRRYLLLDGFEAPGSGGRSIASVVENRLIGIVGNALVLPVANGVQLDPRISTAAGGSLVSLYNAEPLPPATVCLPTRGVFTEAVMGSCNACEQIDESRFWRWEEHPIDEPPAIEPASTATRRAEPPDLTPTPFPTPIVAIQNAPDIPTPAGVGAALDALGKQVFSDITGLEGTQANAAMAYGKALDTALAFGKEASTLAQQAGMLKGGFRNTMDAIDDAYRDGKIDEKQRNDLSMTALKKLVGEGDAGMSTRDVKDLTETAGENNAKVSVQKPTGENVDIDAKPPDDTPPPEKKPRRPQSPAVERVVRVFSTYPGSSAPVGGLYDFAFEDVLSRKKDNGSFQIGVGTPVGQLRVALPAGEWTVISRMQVFLPASITTVPVTVVPGLDPFDFTASQELAGSAVPLEVAGRVSVKPSMRVVDVRLEPVIAEVTVEREIELSTSATMSTEFQSEAKVGVEAAANELIASEKLSGEVAFGAKLGLSGTVGTGQTLKLTITYKKIERFNFVQL
jgi:hypothetical protein